MNHLRPFIRAVFSVLLATAPACAEDEYWGADTIRHFVRDYMAESGKPVGENVAIGPLDERMKVPACGAKPMIAPRSAYSSSLVVHCDAPRAWTYNLRVDQDGDGPRSTAAISAGGPVQQWHVVVPRASLPAGTILAASMLEERDTNVAPGGSFIKSMTEAVGLRLTAPISPGIPLTTRNVVRAPAIMKGETVTLTAEGDGFSIATPGRAEDDGYEGDLLAVRNVKSGMVLMGRLASGGVVLVR
jgi:flagella basal body P-ring formation protein FlgA